MKSNTFTIKNTAGKILLLIFCLGTFQCLAQEYKTTSDSQVWTELTLKKKFLKNFTGSVMQQVRFFKDASEIDDWITDLGVKYKINKHFSVGVNGRYTRNYKLHEPTQNDYRYNADVLYDGNIAANWKVYYRLRYQKKHYGNSVFNEYLNYYSSSFRHRLTLGWQMNEKHQLYVSPELFRITKKSQEPYYNKFRCWVGDEFDLKPGELDASIGFEHQLNNDNPYNYYMLRLKYTLAL